MRPSTFALLLLSSASAAAAAAVSSSSRLPGALSSVVKDLERDGDAEEVRAAAVLFSRGAGAERRSLFSDDGVVVVGDAASGLVLAGPRGAAETAATVRAGAATAVCVCRAADLARGEGLPEGGLSSAAEAGARRLVVLLETTTTDGAADAEAAFRAAVGDAAIDAFEDGVAFVPFSAGDDLAAAASSSVTTTTTTTTTTTAFAARAVAFAPLSARDAAAAARLGPARRAAADRAVAAIAAVARPDEDDDDHDVLVPKYGRLVDAAVDRALAELDAAVAGSSPRVRASPAARRAAADLLADVADRSVREGLERQRAALVEAVFGELKEKLSKLRISAALPAAMDDIVSDAVADLRKRLPALVPKRVDAEPERCAAAFARRARAYAAERLGRARASGSLRPTPRRGVGIGLHWLLPKPFGNDYRQSPVDVTKGSRVFYDPKSGASETRVGETDWRRVIEPVPGAADMMYDPPVGRKDRD